MRKIWKRVTAAALSLTFVLSLSACGGGLSADDATTYVQGILDENYKGVYDPDFLELIDMRKPTCPAWRPRLTFSPPPS